MWWLDPGKEVLNVLFNRILAPYVENLDLNQVNYGIGQGQLTLRSLRLKKGALDKFRLPIDVLEGHLGKFSLSLHWLNLGNQPVEILIEDVYLLVVPSSHNQQDPEEEEERAQAIKRERLENAELLHLRGEAEKSGDQQPQGFWESLLAKVVNNLQISVKNIHIRYEDKYSVPKHPFVAGVTLEGFTAVSVNDNWEAAFIESTAGTIHKLAKLQSLAIYFDTDVKKLESDKKESIFHANATKEAKEAAHSEETKHQFILNPVSGEGRININRKADPKTPRFEVQLFLDTIGVAVDDNQYRDTILLLDSYHMYMRKQQYRKFWSQDEDMNTAKSRLLFACNAVLGSIRERRKQWTWPYLAERRDDRNRYIELFERKAIGNLSSSDTHDIEKLERKLSYEDIRFYRSIARSRLRKDEALRKRLQAEQAPPQPAKQSWSSWIWGSSESNKKEENLFNQPMTEDQKKELYDVIDYDERNAIATSFEAPRDAVKALFSLQLNQGIFALKTNPHNNPQELTSMSFQDFHASFLQRADNFEASMALGDFAIRDGIVKNTLHKKIVSVKHKEAPGGSNDSVEQDEEPFFYANFERNPLDERADSALTVKMRRVQVIYHRGYVEAIYKFFQAPASHLESVEALLSAASETFEGFRKETRAGLEHALQTHKTIDVRMDLNAPVIIIPEDVTSTNCKHLIVDAGHISIESDLAKKDTLREIQMKRKKAYSENDYRQLESLMYDKFSLKLAAAQFVLGTDLNACLDALLPDSKDNLHLLERININLQVHNSIVPSVVDLPRIKVAGKLPLLQLNFSDSKYKALMRLIDVSIPKLGDNQPTEGPMVVSPDTRPFQLATGFFSTGGKEYNVEDHEDTNEEGEEAFFEAEEGTKEGPGSRQHKFDLSFEVAELRASVSRSSPGGEERPLGNVVLRGFSLQLVLAEFNMTVDVDLRSLALDLIQPGAKPLRFISSVEGGQDHSSEDLLVVHYTRAQRNAPDFNSKYNGFDQTVEVKLSTFIFTALPEPIISLYDFIMTTFVPKNSVPPANQPLIHDQNATRGLQLVQSDQVESKIRVQVELASVQVRLISGDEPLATLCLTTASVSVFLSKTLRVVGSLGNLALSNDMESQRILPAFNNILSIEGEELAEFRYQTFDPEGEGYNGIKSSIFLHTASLKLHFLAEPMREILIFMSKLAKVKGLYDAATQAAVQTASNVDVGGMQFDVAVKTPILVYPRNPTQSRDTLIMQLGEINVKNHLRESENKTSGTLNGIQLVSTTYVNDQPASLKMIENININADIIQKLVVSQPEKALSQPDMQISVSISDIKLHLTQVQYTILLALASSVSSVLVSAQSRASQYDPSQSNLAPLPLKSTVSERAQASIVNPEAISSRTSLDLIVTVNAISLHLYDKFANSKDALSEHGIAKFALVDNSLRLKALKDGSIEAQLILRSFTVSNTRPGNSKFREIVPSAQHDRNQFMVLYTMPPTSEAPSVAVVTIDAPQVIFAIDPLIALIDFFSPKEVANQGGPQGNQQSLTPSAEEDEAAVRSTQRLNFRLELHELSVSVLETDSNPDTHCIKLSVHHLLISQQAVLTMSVECLGMCLMRLGKLPESVRFLDDVDLTLSLKSSTSATQQFSSIEALVKPIVFRASYGDITLISSIVQRAIESYEQLGESNPSPEPATTRISTEADRTSKVKASRTSGNARVSLSKEQLTASFDGLRLIMIGDLYEQPLLHLKMNPFILGAKDWSGELHATTTMAIQINYWNLLNSHWEPLIDPWTFTLTAAKDGGSGGMNFGLSARDRLDLNVSTTLVELANTASSIWAKEGSQVLHKPRGTYAPYRLRNRTGSTILVWADDDHSGSKDVNGTKILDNHTVDWRFDGWRATREHVSTAVQHNLCLRFADKEWERLRGIPIDREGEYVFSMRPRTKYPSRLLVEVKVVDAVKIVTVRSTYQVENHTLYPLELMLVNDLGHPIHSLVRIVPGETYPLPIDVASSSRIRLQPDQGFGYKWCQAIRWEDLIARKSFTIKCPHAQPEEAAFRFQASVHTDARELTSRAFPKIALKLRAPLELENLLPYNLEYRIYDKDTDQNWRSYLRKGGVMPVHSVELSHFVLLNVFLQDTVFHASEFAIINTDGHSDFDIESRVTLRDQRNRKLDLRLNYVRYADSGGAFRVQIYAPVIFVNKTGLPFFVRTTRSTRAGSQDVAGDTRLDALAEPSPYLASHPYENGHEYILKVGHSAWSKTISLEAPTAESALVVPSEKQKAEEIHVGVSWSEGHGKYKLTKIVTLTPRFLLKNDLSEPISYREHGYPPRDNSIIQPGERAPLHFIKAGDEKLVTIAYPGLNSQWSAPINMEDIGFVHLRLRNSHEGSSHIPLVRTDIRVDASTIFVTFSRATEWPFLVENRSDYLVNLSQTNTGQSTEQSSRKSNPTYQIEPGSDLGYAWDLPAVREKKVLLLINNTSRIVDIMEIGNLVPFKFHDKKTVKAVSLDVRAAGQQQILRISNYHPDRSLYKPRNRNPQSITRQDTISSTAEFEPVSETVLPTLSLNLDMAGIGVSLMNKKMFEVLYASINALKLEYTSSPVAQSFNVSCGTLQIDNQLHDALYPVLLQPTPINRESTGVAALPTVQGSIIWLNDQEHGVLFVKYCSILLQALTIEFDEDLLFAIIDLVKVQGLSWEESDDSLLLEDIETIPEPAQNSGGEELYFEVLELQPIKLSLSFMRTERALTLACNRTSIRNPIAVALNAFTMAVGNINDAPLEMNALGIKDMHLTMPELTARVGYHYRQEVLRQLYRLLGSADFIGNPVGLFTNVSSGVADIFYEPFHGNVMHGNKELGLGIAKGAASFVKKTVFGLSDSVTKFTSSVGKGLSAATFDPEYQARRRIAQRRNKPRHAIYGVAAGGEAFASSVTSAVEGVLMKPIEGAEQEGAVGFLKGIGKGFVGVVTKPVVGVFDLASNVSEGIRNTTTVFDSPERDRVRLPRHVSADGILRPYSAREALGQYWMRDLNSGAYRQESYVAHINSAGDEKVVLLTRARILSFWVKNLRLEWDLPFGDVHGITVEDTGIRFGHKAGKENDRFAFIPDKSSQSWFFGQLSTVVKAYNAKKRMDS